MKDKLIELWCKATKEKELEEYTEDARNLYDYTMKIVEENERLNNKNEELLTLYTSEREVKDYYKNIINELEKKLLELRLTDVDGKTIVYRLLEKLQELKGSDK